MSDLNNHLPFGGLPGQSPRSVTVEREIEPQPEVQDQQSERLRERAYQPRRNTLAVVAFVLAFFIPLLGIIAGAVAQKRIKKSGERGRPFAIWAVIVGVLGTIAGIVAIVSMVLAGGAFISALTGGGSQEAAFVEQAVTPEEQVRIDEAIASGGGGVPGHIVSAELCTAIDNFAAVGGSAIMTDEVPAELITALDVLAAVPSPNQPVYAAFGAFLKDPNAVTNIADAQAIATNAAEAMQFDIATCM